MSDRGLKGLPIFKLLLGLLVLALLGIVLAKSFGRFGSAEPAPKESQVPIVYSQASTDAGAAAVATARSGVESAPDSAAAWVALGDAQLAGRQFRDASASYRKGLALDPDNSNAWSALGETLIQTTESRTAQMPDEARHAFAEALKRNPDDLRAIFYQTLELDFAGQHDKAIGRWLKMLSLTPAGSHESQAIRDTITASVRRNLQTIDREMQRALEQAPQAGQPPAASPALR